MIFVRESIHDINPQSNYGSFVIYSTGQRWGNATYTIDWSTGTLTISDQYASNDWNPVNFNAIERVAYR